MFIPPCLNKSPEVYIYSERCDYLYKNNGAPLLLRRRRHQRAPLRGEDLADDRVEAVAVLHGGEDGRPAAAHLARVAAHFSNELADFSVYVIDVAGGDKVPRKGGPGITQADVLVVNKVDLAPAVGADLDVMRRDARKMRGAGPTVFAAVKKGEGLEAIIGEIFAAQRRALAAAAE